MVIFYVRPGQAGQVSPEYWGRFSCLCGLVGYVTCVAGVAQRDVSIL